jgi:Cu+-exporting ATPase
LASAIVAAAQERGITTSPPARFEALTGRGVRGEVGGHQIAVGNDQLIAELRIADDSLRASAERLRHDGQTVVNIVLGGHVAGLIGIADPIKPSTPDALAALRQQGMKVMMLTGDNRTTAAAVAAKLGLRESDFEAEVRPERKLEVVRELKQSGEVVAMAGDGINDAPALAAADVGIAMGTGTDIAIESGGITLLKGDLRGLVRARRLSRATMRSIRQNLFWAFIYNVLGVPIAAGVLYPVFGSAVLLSPIVAAAAMSFSSVSVIGNSLRLRHVQL